MLNVWAFVLAVLEFKAKKLIYDIKICVWGKNCIKAN
jgi:hypothetical protein